MEQEFVIDSKYPFIKASVDKPNELYIFKCLVCKKTLELGFDYAKTNDMKQTSSKFVLVHKKCTTKNCEQRCDENGYINSIIPGTKVPCPNGCSKKRT